MIYFVFDVYYYCICIQEGEAPLGQLLNDGVDQFHSVHLLLKGGAKPDIATKVSYHNIDVITMQSL